ncbi:hypothetical protein HNQ93_002222 [Hymenobacter luteus]|uniref:Uncharacterized protein n=2 Tax=Hymenobacter TaxID=89966 RepID=A0A7W9WD68_9BACT|nr:MULTISPECIES: hypothetical protein [Hymenobacter]MBB4602209.1 hypothetical protein [Hymenobacter latericoloratus]MBB6059362.1 hypothetical protein [Hymenobacter luteus]
MNKVLPLAALVIALGLIIFLYQRLRTTEAALAMAQKRFDDCEQVNFQLQNQLVQATRGPVPDSLKIVD